MQVLILLSQWMLLRITLSADSIFYVKEHLVYEYWQAIATAAETGASAWKRCFETPIYHTSTCLYSSTRKFVHSVYSHTINLATPSACPMLKSALANIFLLHVTLLKSGRNTVCLCVLIISRMRMFLWPTNVYFLQVPCFEYVYFE